MEERISGHEWAYGLSREGPRPFEDEQKRIVQDKDMVSSSVNKVSEQVTEVMNSVCQSRDCDRE